MHTDTGLHLMSQTRALLEASDCNVICGNVVQHTLLPHRESKEMKSVRISEGPSIVFTQVAFHSLVALNVFIFRLIC